MCEEDSADEEDSHAMAEEGGEAGGEEASAAGSTREHAQPSSQQPGASSDNVGAAACNQQPHANLDIAEERTLRASREGDAGSSGDDGSPPLRVMQFRWVTLSMQQGHGR